MHFIKSLEVNFRLTESRRCFIIDRYDSEKSFPLPYQIWRRIEVAITSLTRNQVVGQPAHGFESLRLRFFQNAECLSLCGCSAFFMGGEVDEFRVTLGYTFFSRTQCSFEFSDRFKNRENGEKSIFIISAG